MVREGLLAHDDWIELDRGTLDPDDAIVRTAGRTSLPASEIARLLAAVPAHLEPKPDTVELVEAVRRAGHRMLVLSNMHHASIDYIERTHAFWQLFDDAVVSSRIELVKPDVRIYEYLLDTFDIAASETLFIDDMPENVESAATLGIHTIQFQDVVQCERELRDRGVLTGE